MDRAFIRDNKVIGEILQFADMMIKNSELLRSSAMIDQIYNRFIDCQISDHNQVIIIEIIDCILNLSGQTIGENILKLKSHSPFRII